MANVIRYFPTQALNFAFKDTVKSMFKTAKDAPQYEKFGKNILSGGVAGSLSLTFVYSLDYCRTRCVMPICRLASSGLFFHFFTLNSSKFKLKVFTKLKQI